MSTQQIDSIKRIFSSRLETLEHILDLGKVHFNDPDKMMDLRLSEDMFPLGAQVALICNQPRGFSQWCAGLAIENLSIEVPSLEMAQYAISQTKDLINNIHVDDGQLNRIKRIGLGPGRFCEVSGHLYVEDYLMPNFYFHLTTVYALLRAEGIKLGKADFLTYLAPYVKTTD